MNTKSTMSKAPKPVFFPDDLIVEILSLLPVKSVVRFKGVNNSWNTLISDPAFEKFHLKRSTTSRNTHFTLVTNHYTPEGETYYDSYDTYCTVIPYPITHLFDNPSSTFLADSHYFLNNDDRPKFHIVGSCNGLICLLYLDFTYTKFWFRLWNPATRIISQQFGYSHHLRLGFTFKFGFDDSTCTFKVVAYRFIPGRYTSEVKLFTIGDNVWKNIDSFPIVPLAFEFKRSMGNCNWSDDGCVFSNSSLNWLAIRKDLHDVYERSFLEDWAYLRRDINVEDLVIVSLDLGTETYNRYRLPQGFVELPLIEPIISVLGEWLCFSYFDKGNDMVIWQMKKFGREESWIQFHKINYHVLQLYYDFSYNRIQLLPLFLSKDGDSLILLCYPNGSGNGNDGEAIIYNRKDNCVQRIRANVHKTIIDDKNINHLCLHLAKGYVESLISIY